MAAGPLLWLFGSIALLGSVARRLPATPQPAAAIPVGTPELSLCMAALLLPRLFALTLHPALPGAHTYSYVLSRDLFSRETALLLPPIARRRRISALKRARRHARRRAEGSAKVSQCPPTAMSRPTPHVWSQPQTDPVTHAPPPHSDSLPAEAPRGAHTAKEPSHSLGDATLTPPPRAFTVLFTPTSWAMTHKAWNHLMRALHGNGREARIVTLNINWAKEKIGIVLNNSRRGGIDALLLQQTGFYQADRSGRHWHAQDFDRTVRAHGWTGFYSAATETDRAAGVAILVRTNSASIDCSKSVATEHIASRLLSVTCIVNGELTNLVSLYAPSKERKRRAFFRTITDRNPLNANSIVGGDFNCVADTSLDTYRWGRGSYANKWYTIWAAYAASKGWIDVHRRVNGDSARTGFSRIDQAHKVSTRIDQIYAPAYGSIWRWHSISTDPALCTSSDHYPVVAQLETAPKRDPTAVEANIDRSLFDDYSAWKRVETMLEHVYATTPPSMYGEGYTFAVFQEAIAHEFRELTSHKRRSRHPTAMLRAELRKRHAEFEKDPSDGFQARRVATVRDRLRKAESERKRSRDQLARIEQRSERQTKSFFRHYKSKHSNTDIPTLSKTPDWEQHPDVKEGEATDTNEVLAEATSYHSHLSQPKPSDPEQAKVCLDALRKRTISKRQRESLEGKITLDEVIAAIRSMKDDKAAGPNGLPAEFFKRFEALLAKPLHRVFLEVAERGWQEESTREGVVSLLYKKGDAREIRNYRPITLLQVEYKIYAKILVSRMKRVVDSFVSIQQLGFVPGRKISEASQLVKLIQAYLDEEDDEGFILALDWEKAFDRVSWDYFHSALEALNFGPAFRRMVGSLTNSDHPPSRQIRINGVLGPSYTIHCGVPQGCPLSPIAFLVVAEALTRLVLDDDGIEGVQVGETVHKISQFADDTTLLLRTLASLPAVWRILDVYESATGMRANPNKFEGILCGALRHRGLPADHRGLAGQGALINWLASGQRTKLLGIPFWINDENAADCEEQFWEHLYFRTKTAMARWRQVFTLTVHGRVMIANAMVYSRPRYWMQVMAAPRWFHDAIESDVRALLWSKDPTFDGDAIGTDKDGQPWIRREALSLRRQIDEHGNGLGLALLDWPNHVRALQTHALLSYLDASQAPWKLVLDQWFARSYLRRGAVLAAVQECDLCRPRTEGAPLHLPSFWVDALDSIRYLHLTPITGALSREGVQSMPLWDNLFFKLPQSVQVFRDLWERVAAFNLNNLTKRDGSLYTDSEIWDYIRVTARVTPCDEFLYYKGTRYTKRRILDSWRRIMDAIPEEYMRLLTCAPPEPWPGCLFTVSAPAFTARTRNPMRPPSHSFVQQLNNERPPPPGALQLVAAMRPGFTLSTGLGAHEQGSTVSVASRASRDRNLGPDPRSQTSPSRREALLKGPDRARARSKRLAQKQKVICAIDGDNNHTFYIVRGNTCHVASIDSKGRVACTPTVTSTLDPDTTYPAVRWGAGYKGPTVTSYPLPSEFSFEGQATPLDRLTVKHLTLLFTAHVHKPPSCLTSWPRRLRVQALATCIPTATVSDGRHSATIATPVSVHRNSIPTLAPLTQHFRNTGLLSFKDWHLYFKHILHRALSTRHRRGEARTVCRLCHRERESCAHLGRCRIIAHLFSRIKLIIPDTPAPSRDRILFCYVEDQRLPLVTTTLCLLLWKFTLIDFYRVDIDNVTFKADDVWTATLTRLVHAAASKCVHIRSLRRRYHSRGEQPPPRFLDRFQLLVAPLFSYGEYGQLYFSEALTRHLKCRDLHHLLDYATKRDDAASRGDAAPSDDAATAAAGQQQQQQQQATTPFYANWTKRLRS